MTSLDVFKTELGKLSIGSARKRDVEALAQILYDDAKKEGVDEKADHDLFHLTQERADSVGDAEKIARIDEAINATNLTKLSHGSSARLADSFNAEKGG